MCRGGGVGGEGLGDEEDIPSGKKPAKIPRARFFGYDGQGSFSSTRKYCGSSKAAKVWVTRKTYTKVLRGSVSNS